MGLLTDAQKGGLSSVFSQLHETFKKEVFAYKHGEYVVITHNPSYSSIYGPTSSKVSNPAPLVRKSFYARILYGTKQNLESLDSAGTKFKLTEGQARIKVDNEGYLFIKDAKKIELDGKLFEFITSGRPHGLFNNDFYTFYLKEIQ